MLKQIIVLAVLLMASVGMAEAQSGSSIFDRWGNLRQPAGPKPAYGISGGGRRAITRSPRESQPSSIKKERRTRQPY
jgi:hypothetical protein